MNSSPCLLAATLVDGEWITAFIVAVIGAIGGVWVAYRKGQASTSTRIDEPVPVIRTSRVSVPPTWDQHVELVHRVTSLEHTTAELRRDLAAQFRELLQAGGERELRLAEKLDGMARGIHHRIDEILKNCATQAGACHRKS
jgi:hypothetical protein